MDEDFNDSLKHMEVFSVLQSIQMRKLTGTLECVSGNRRICILFDHGKPARARSESFGDEAVLDYLSMAHNEAGSCSFTEDAGTSPGKSSEVNETLVNLLLKGAANRPQENAATVQGEKDGKSENKCSFCFKNREDVAMLIAGPGVRICDECVEVCTEVLSEKLFSTTDLKPGTTENPSASDEESEEDVRTNLLDLIVTQALHGVDWRVICAGPMMTNRITPAEVEAEIVKRLSSPDFKFANLFGKNVSAADFSAMFDLVLGQMNQLRSRIQKLEDSP